MAFYVQYDENGNIGATVSSSTAAPAHPRQLVFAEEIPTDGKRVNLETLELEDLPPEPPAP